MGLLNYTSTILSEPKRATSTVRTTVFGLEHHHPSPLSARVVSNGQSKGTRSVTSRGRGSGELLFTSCYGHNNKDEC